MGCRKAAKYLPRKTGLSTSTGKNQSGRQDTQRGAWAADSVAAFPAVLVGTANPPPGTTQ